MRPDQIQKVTETAMQVLVKLTGVSSRMIRVSWREGLSELPPFSVAVGIEGGGGGALCLLLERNVARLFAEKMTGDHAMASAPDEEVAFVLMELINIIAGNAMGVLSGPSAPRSITPPALLNPQATYFADYRLAVAQLDSDAGRYHLAMFSE